MTRSVNRTTVDPEDVWTWSFDATAWCVEEATSLASYTLTPTETITVLDDSSTGPVVTAELSASASGRLTCRWVFADGQSRDRTLTITVRDL